MQHGSLHYASSVDTLLRSHHDRLTQTEQLHTSNTGEKLLKHLISVKKII